MRVLVTVALLLLVVTSPVLYRGHRISQVPEIGDPFDVDACLDFEVPDERNAFVEYRQAAASYVANRPKELKFMDGVTAGHRWGEITAADREWLTRNFRALDVWRKGTEKPDALFEHPRDMTWESLSGMDELKLRQFVFLAFLKSVFLQRAGNHSESLEWLLAAYRFSRHSAMHGSMRVYSTTFHRMTCGAILMWAGHTDVSAKQLRKAREAVNTLYAMTPPASDNLKLDYLITKKLLQRDDVVEVVLKLENSVYGCPSKRYPDTWQTRSRFWVDGDPVVSRRLWQREEPNRVF